MVSPAARNSPSNASLNLALPLKRSAFIAFLLALFKALSSASGPLCLAFRASFINLRIARRRSSVPTSVVSFNSLTLASSFSFLGILLSAALCVPRSALSRSLASLRSLTVRAALVSF